MNDLVPPSGESGFAWLQLWAETTGDHSISALSLDGIVLTWNLGGERIQGYRPEEIIGQSFSVFYPEADRAAGAPGAALRTATRTGRHAIEGWRLRKNGSTFWANVAMTALRDRNGQVNGFAKVVSDVSDKKAAHDAVLQRERNFRLLFRALPTMPSSCCRRADM